MQDAYSSIPHSLWELARTTIVGLLVGATTYLFARKRNLAETRKTDAETHHIQLTDQIAEGDLLVRLMQTGAQAVIDVEQLRGKLEFQRRRADRLEEECKAVAVERDLIQLELDRYIRIGKGNGKRG